ncbi:MAG TPA: chemotaxis protein CheA [Gemmatimonadaceae bacterium]|nr:chemotaxis protein CheA [Gemmatimonadaceae bacterium]
MSPTGGEASFFDQFIEDYYSECDEHLATARRVLLALEGSAADGSPAPPMHELLRSLHTLKGLSGMVGDACAEQVSHALEDAVRGIELAGGRPAPAALDALFAGVDGLQRCVAAHRLGEAGPDVDALVATIAGLAPRATPADARSASDTRTVAEALGREESTVVYRFEFVPSAELSGRGVGVDAVRARLRAVGTLLDAKPRVFAGGVVFDFLVAARAGVQPDAAWAADGLRWSLEGELARPAADDAPVAPSADAPAAPASPPTAATGVSGASVVRVDLGRLDDVMRLVGDLVVSRSRLEDALRGAASADQSALLDVLADTNAAMERQLRQLREGVMRIRLVPVGEVFERLRFAARDAIRESGKQVRLVFHGQSTEIDKVVVDRMLEPLLHLVRNAVSHGIEGPTERVARGKAPEGTLSLRATASGDRIRIVVEDDGAGIDVDRVVQRAREHGLALPEEALTDEQLLAVLCEPGFSTRDEADRTSGRGVGMDVVRSAVRALSGELAMETVDGRGTAFTIELPLTLMILDALLVDVGGQQMAVPQPALREIVQVETASIVTFENNAVVRYRDGVLPIVHLARLFGFAEAPASRCYLLVVGTEAAPMGLRVDRLIGLREIVVHPVADRLVAMPGVAGATDLGSGRVSLILDTAALLRMAEEQRDERAAARLAAPPSRHSSGART